MTQWLSVSRKRPTRLTRQDTISAERANTLRRVRSVAERNAKLRQEVINLRQALRMTEALLKRVTDRAYDLEDEIKNAKALLSPYTSLFPPKALEYIWDRNGCYQLPSGPLQPFAIHDVGLCDVKQTFDAVTLYDMVITAGKDFHNSGWVRLVGPDGTVLGLGVTPQMVLNHPPHVFAHQISEEFRKGIHVNIDKIRTAILGGGEFPRNYR